MDILRVIKISRPLGYLIGPFIFLIPIFLYQISIGPIILIQTLLLTFPLCFLLFGINDVYDIESDKRNPRKGGVEGIILKEDQVPSVLKIAAASAIILFIPALFRPSILNLFATSLIIFLAWAYSAPPIRFKEKPPLDSLSNAIIIYLIFLLGLSYGPGFQGFPGQGYYLLFGVIGIHIFSTIMDYTPDSKAGITTFSTIFGKRLSALMSLLIFIFIILFSGVSSWIIITYISILALISFVIFINPNERFVTFLFRAIFILFMIFSLVYLASIFLL